MSTARARETFHHGGGTVHGGQVFDAAHPLVLSFRDFFDVEGPAPEPEVIAVPPVVAGRPRGRRPATSEQGDGGDSE